MLFLPLPEHPTRNLCLSYYRALYPNICFNACSTPQVFIWCASKIETNICLELEVIISVNCLFGVVS